MARRKRPPRPGALSELPPLKLLTQLLALQTLYYLTSLTLHLFTSLVTGTPFTLSLVFSWTSLRGDTTAGYLSAFIALLSGGFFAAVAIIALVGRSKLVLDFALSLHAIHLVVVTVYSGELPKNKAWWVTMAVASGVCVGVATWGCRYRELRPISFGGVGGGTAVRGGGVGDVAGDVMEGRGGGSGEVGDEEQGFSRGRGRGRGRDGAGEYEMVKMNGDTGGGTAAR
ncbi:integral membrane protein S linking to the trans Golgi network-domain-containing protein [Echria macrotheca]|uniref:Integral membrane protein S linking to the trans Golgi network-domain-containing protein n=1 Tax=Echria macrotheca TaxID=438768 RepID=A0AAJ0B7D2_9PEZI|nr:integral membrane protein S linking to the trans Golgi network-domain-containing protein [Echria macrotheca]